MLYLVLVIDLRNKIMPLTVPSLLHHLMLTPVPTASHDQESCHILFQLSSPNEQICATDDVVSVTQGQC